ncbi:MAG: nucleotide exchange factor GrpE [Balneolaceae bacterium]|nr:nucleotide exchange factor GrpE [Balneolaceae bacterium]
MSTDKTPKKETENSEEMASKNEVAEETVLKDQEETKPTETNEDEARIAELEQELASSKDSLLRKAAELENVRKRVRRERIQLFEEAKAGALEDFMPIYDDLVRSLQAAEESKVEDSFLEGVKMVSKKFQNVLEKHGVERIDEAGVPFDVNLHDAMMKQPASDDETESDMVLQVLESGYRIGNRTIRHAKVIVSE